MYDKMGYIRVTASVCLVDGIKGASNTFIHAAFIFIGFILIFSVTNLVTNNQKSVANYIFRYSIKLRNKAVCFVFRNESFINE